MDNQVTVLSGGKPGLPLVIISWILLFLLAAFATIPFLGIVSWLVAIPILIMTSIFSVVILMNGRTFSGVVILISSLILVPAYIFFAPLVSTVIAGYFMTGECEITITDSQGNRVKKRADLKHLTFSDWKDADKGNGRKKNGVSHKAVPQIPDQSPGVVPGQVPAQASADKTETDSERASSPAESGKGTATQEEPAAGQEKWEYI